MSHKIGILAATLIVCALAGPARAELSGSGAADAETGGSQNAVFSLLDKYASDSQSLASTPISETSLISALTKTGALMNAYDSILGSNSPQVIASTSASPPYFTTSGTGPSATVTEAGLGLAALVQWGIPVGSSAMVSGESVAPLSGFSASPIVTSTNLSNLVTIQASPPPPVPSPVPIPLPFFLTGSGLAALLAFKRRGGNNAVV